MSVFRKEDALIVSATVRDDKMVINCSDPANPELFNQVAWEVNCHCLKIFSLTLQICV